MMAKRERTVSFCFRRAGLQHTAGINALLLSPDQRHLWTGSRDSLVKQWDVSEQMQHLTQQQKQRPLSPPLVATYRGHADWVTALAQLQGLLVSASSDRTLRVWAPTAQDTGGSSQGSSTPTMHARACLSGHSDYVTCLAAAEPAGVVASGGLRGEVLLWDVARLQAVLRSTASELVPIRREAGGSSIYALAMDPGARLVAAGCTDHAIRLLDTRSGVQAMRLVGHTDNVRALALSPDGTLLLSVGSDHALRLWNLGQQRCVSTMAIHTDSVWALDVDPGFHAAYSGGRDGCVYRTSLATRTAELLLREQQPITSVALGPGGARDGSVGGVWVATEASTVRLWSVDGEFPAAAPVTPRGGGLLRRSSEQEGCAFVAGPSPAQRARMRFAGAASCPPPRQAQPAACIPGLPPILAAAVMTDRRHVLTQDAEGSVQLWDVTAGAVVREYGQRDMQEVERELFQPTHCVSPWFSPDTKLGSLAGHLQTPQCFHAECYAQDLGFADAPPDEKLNLGEQMLKALFHGWVDARQRQVEDMAAVAQLGPDLASEHAAGFAEQQQQQRGPLAHAVAGSPDAARGPGSAVHSQRAGATRSSSDSPASLPAFSFSCTSPPLIMITGGDSVPWTCATIELDGSEEQGREVPGWVADCVLRQQYPAGKELKTAFQLTPMEGSDLPALLLSKLNAPRVLRLNKVADYVVKKMQEQGISLRLEPLFWDPAKQEQWEREQEAATAAQEQGQASDAEAGAQQRMESQQPPPASPRGRPLLITCNGMVVPWDFSLSAIKQWIWKCSDDLVLAYDVRDGRTPLRLPAIRMPG